jgi:hypothetical protein
VESLTGIIEHHDGRMELVKYEDFFRQERMLPVELEDEEMVSA